MYEYLRGHPDVFMPYRKEPLYFGSDLVKRPPYLDEAGYLALFEGASGERRIGEATVWYLYSQTAPQEIRDFSPDARIIIMLRNPVDMIHSLHSHLLFTANEDIESFEEALRAEPDRRAGRRLPARMRRPEGLQYRACGRYARHVKRYFDAFGRERVHVIVYDDMRSDLPGVFRGTLEFLEVDPLYRPDFRPVNENKRARSELLRRLGSAAWFIRATSRLSPRVFHAIQRSMRRANIQRVERAPLSAALRRELQADFASDVAELGRLLGRDLGHWTAAAESGRDADGF